MTFDELKTAANEMGYDLVVKRFEDGMITHCGTMPHEWMWTRPKERIKYFIRCPVCGVESDKMPSSEAARENWNKKVRGF